MTLPAQSWEVRCGAPDSTPYSFGHDGGVHRPPVPGEELGGIDTCDLPAGHEGRHCCADPIGSWDDIADLPAMNDAACTPSPRRPIPPEDWWPFGYPDAEAEPQAVQALARAMAEVRKTSGLALVDMARALNVDLRTATSIELGFVQPTLWQLVKWAQRTESVPCQILAMAGM